jgi:hypothetical protein
VSLLQREPGAAAAIPARAMPEHAGAPPADLSACAYRLLAVAVIAAYLVVWAASFRHVYGLIMDDYMVYQKAVEVVGDWHRAFAYFNLLHPYFFVVSYLPLKMGFSLPSYTLPVVGEQTGQFRFLLLYCVVLHAALLAVWAWFASRIARRLVAFLSLLLFATSPTLAFWGPKPDSRLLGVPFALVGLWLLWRAARGGSASPRLLSLFFAAGSLFALAQGIHYTVLYLIVPLGAAFWAQQLYQGWRSRPVWLGLVAFGLGGLWLPLVLEATSYLALGLPREQGPLATLLRLREGHLSPWSLPELLAIWAELLLNQMGALLLAASAAGWVLALRRRPGPGWLAPGARWTVLAGMPAAVLYIGLSGTMPFFRQVSVLQPFWCLFAGLAVVALSDRLARPGPRRALALAALVAAAGLAQWAQAATVFQAHQSLGRALVWVEQHRGERAVASFPLGWLYGSASHTLLADVEQAPADTWLINHWPWTFLATHPALRPAALAAPALAAWPSLYATDTVWSEGRGFGHNDFRDDALLREIRVVEAGALRAAMAGAPLAVSAVEADSTAAPETEALNDFDADRCPRPRPCCHRASRPRRRRSGPRSREAVRGRTRSRCGSRRRSRSARSRW